MLFAIFSGLLTASASEFQPKYDLAFETGYLAHGDGDWGYLGWPENTVGVRAGYHLSSRLSVVTSFQSISNINSTGYNSYSYYDEEYEYVGGSSLDGARLGIRSNQLSVGPKLAVEIKRWFVPYATAQGLITHAHLQMGDTLEEDDAKTYIKDSAFGVGTIGALGLEMRTRPIQGKFQLNTYIEAGGGISSNMNFKVKDLGEDDANLPIGDLKYAGQYIRFGIGTRF